MSEDCCETLRGDRAVWELLLREQKQIASDWQDMAGVWKALYMAKQQEYVDLREKYED